MRTLKFIRIALPLFCVLIASFAVHATILFQDSLNYPYTNGCIEGQGQWYLYYPKGGTNRDALVLTNVLILNTTNKDCVATPTNGWTNPTEFNYASFRLKVNQVPGNPNGGYFCQFQTTNDSLDCCHVFIDTQGTSVPGTYRLGIGNYATSFSSLQPPVNYPLDLATGVWYNVVVLFDTNQADATFVGATLFVNPSEQDYENLVAADGNPGEGFVFGTDSTADINRQNIQITQIGFSPYTDAGISNVIAATTFDEVNSTNPPAFGIQPQSATGYSGNPTTLYAVASGADVTYQWYSTTFGKLSDGVAYTGSASDTLTVNNLSASDNYYCVATDAYNDTATTTDAVETVITTNAVPFFPTNVVGVNVTTNVFATISFNDPALGTGPLYYQWFFASNVVSSINTNLTYTTNIISGFITTNYTYMTNYTLSAGSPIPSATAPVLTLALDDFTYAGGYYVVASNTIAGGSVAVGPTNTLVETPPNVLSMLQLHNLMISDTNQIENNPGGTVVINSTNVTLAGYVTGYQPFGNSYTLFYIQDASGLGSSVYLYGYVNTNAPPVGTYVTVSGPLAIYNSAPEIEPASLVAISTTNTAPVIPLSPHLANSVFNDLITNSFGNNALTLDCSLLTFTNCYIYGDRHGGPITNNGTGPYFVTNGYTFLYYTCNGPYNTNTLAGPINTNVMQLFQNGYDLGTGPNPWAFQTIPSYCYQLTGEYDDYAGAGELEPSRLADYVTNPPPDFSISLSQAGADSTVTWQPNVGSTYSVYASTNLLGPWVQEAYGLAYYPTNGAFTETNAVRAKFYQVTSP